MMSNTNETESTNELYNVTYYHKVGPVFIGRKILNSVSYCDARDTAEIWCDENCTSGPTLSHDGKHMSYTYYSDSVKYPYITVSPTESGDNYIVTHYRPNEESIFEYEHLVTADLETSIRKAEEFCKITYDYAGTPNQIYNDTKTSYTFYLNTVTGPYVTISTNKISCDYTNILGLPYVTISQTSCDSKPQYKATYHHKIGTGGACGDSIFTTKDLGTADLGTSITKALTCPECEKIPQSVYIWFRQRDLQHRGNNE